jgi:alpha/beta superfamily hydrolase
MIRQFFARALLFPLIILASVCEAKAPPLESNSVEILITNRQKTKVKASYHQAETPKALILLFHQAGADRSEYNDIVPRLLLSGFSTLTVDQRGGGLFSNMNDGKPDMEAALNWAQDKSLPVIIWGSSYSASIVYVLAAEQPTKMMAALAFSGGNYLGKNIVPTAARKITMPFFATSALDEVAEMKAIFDLTASTQKKFFTPTFLGIHGSGTLSHKQNPKGAEESWAAVLDFLNSVIR